MVVSVTEMPKVQCSAPHLIIPFYTYHMSYVCVQTPDFSVHPDMHGPADTASIIPLLAIINRPSIRLVPMRHVHTCATIFLKKKLYSMTKQFARVEHHLLCLIYLIFFKYIK